MNGQYAKEYIREVGEKYATGHANEHAYRPALDKLFEDITGLRVVNDPKKSEYGAPDFVFLKGKVVVAYAEAKDIKYTLDDIEKSEQLVRYYGYSNLILTNYVEFRFFRNGQRYGETILIGERVGDKIEPIEKNLILLEDTINDFIKESKEPIKSGTVLAKVMAGKARRIRDNVKTFLADGDSVKNAELLSVYEVIKKTLLADKFVVFTGELEAFSRPEAEKLVRQAGGNPSSGVSKNTGYVVAGRNPGTKYDKAKKLGVKIITEEEFSRLLSAL